MVVQKPARDARKEAAGSAGDTGAESQGRSWHALRLSCRRTVTRGIDKKRETIVLSGLGVIWGSG